MMNNLNRRSLIKGGLMAATAVPFLPRTPAIAVSHTMYPRVGHRALAMNDRVIGIGVCITDAGVAEPSRDVDSEEVNFSDELIARLLHVSFLNGDGDPRTVQLDHTDIMRMAERVMSEEKQAINILRESSLYWVEANPVFLYALGAGVSMCIYPFLQGFFSELGSRVADWLWEQVVQGDGGTNDN